MNTVELNANYQVASGPVFLTITIGDAQIGRSIVFLDDKKVGIGDFTKFKIGDGEGIKGKTVNIKSIVADVNDMTNKTSITYVLAGGTTDHSFAATGTVENDGDAMIFKAHFSLV
jgi:hypothetical protein